MTCCGIAAIGDQGTCSLPLTREARQAIHFCHAFLISCNNPLAKAWAGQVSEHLASGVPHFRRPPYKKKNSHYHTCQQPVLPSTLLAGTGTLGITTGMAYQRTQPSLPPPIRAQQGSSNAQESPMCTPSCSTTRTTCGSPAGISYQMTQSCLPPPIFVQPRPTGSANAPGPAFVPMCHAVITNPGPAASMEVSSSSGGPRAEQPCLPLVEMTPPSTAGNVGPNMAMYSRANTEASPAPCPEAMPAYVTPGSTVSLHPSGRITVRPGPVGEASVSVGTSMPHVS